MHALHRNWGWLLALGILLIIMGVFLVLAPAAGTLAVEIFIGWLLIIGGVAQIVHAFSVRGWDGFLLHLLGGIVYLVVGGLMVLYPFEGVLALTLLLAAFLLVQGVFQIVAAFRIRPVRSWGWMLASGIATLILGVLIWVGWPGAALWVIGLLVGLHLLFSGFALIMLALAARRHETEGLEQAV